MLLSIAAALANTPIDTPLRLCIKFFIVFSLNDPWEKFNTKAQRRIEKFFYDSTPRDTAESLEG